MCILSILAKSTASLMMSCINTSILSFIPTLLKPTMNLALKIVTLREVKVSALVLMMIFNVVVSQFWKVKAIKSQIWKVKAKIFLSQSSQDMPEMLIKLSQWDLNQIMSLNLILKKQLSKESQAKKFQFWRLAL